MVGFHPWQQRHLHDRRKDQEHRGGKPPAQLLLHVGGGEEIPGSPDADDEHCGLKYHQDHVDPAGGAAEQAERLAEEAGLLADAAKHFALFIAQRLVDHGVDVAHHWSPSKAPRSLWRACMRRVFTVPAGTARATATCATLMSSR